MKPFLIFLFTTITPVLIYSQNITVKSFKQLSSDMDARVTFPKTDQNGQKCAIIKVQTTETGFSWDGDMLGIVASEKKVGEYWLYIPRGAKRLTIKHERLGVLRDYPYPESIKEATVYEMVLTTGKVVTTIEDYKPTTQFMVITSIPDGADVFINDQHKGVTPFQQEMTEGEYNYRVVKEFYYTEAGKFSLKASEGKKELKFNLKPNYGFAEIITKPENGMNISIDGVPLLQTTPLITEKLLSGKHTILVSKTLFHEQTSEITINDNQTSKVEFDLKPAFGRIKVDSNPEAGATVILDGKETGQITPCILDRIVSGSHVLTIRKEWFEPKTVKLEVIDGKEEVISLKMQPTYGTVRLISDLESELYIDNQLKGKENWEGRLVSGWHTFEAKKEKHHSINKKLEVLIGDNKELILNPVPILGSLKVVVNPIGTKILIDGKEYGLTPNIINNLFVGEYNLRLEKFGYGTITKSITIKENSTTEINETLTTGMSVSIESEPKGALLTIDGKPLGITPINLTLGFGNHEIKLVNGKKVIEETIKIEETGKRVFNYNVNEDVLITVKSRVKGMLLTVDGSYWGTPPKMINLLYGKHIIKFEKENISIEKDILVSPSRPNEYILRKRDFAKEYFRKHRYSFYYGFHTTLFSNKTFWDNNLNKERISQEYGHAISFNANFYPTLFSISFFNSGFSTKNLPPFEDNSRISHRGIETAISYNIPIDIIRSNYVGLNIGVGYQLSQLYSNNLIFDGSASTNTSLPLVKFGILFKIRRIMIFEEVKRTIAINGSGFASFQLYAGIGLNF